MAAGAGGVALDDRLGARVPVERTECRREHAVEPRERREIGRLFRRHDAAGHAELVLQGDRAPERHDVVGPVEEKEVADTTEVDLRARSLVEVVE